jgi:ribosome-binding ATPase
MPSFALVGPPGSGKSTVFELLAGVPASRQVLKANFTADRAMIPVPDPRIERLIEMYNPKKRTPASFEIIDIPGFDETLDEKIRTAGYVEIRKADGIAMVLDLFTPGTAELAAGVLRLAWDEMIFADYAVVERGIDNVEMAAKSKQNPDAERRLAFLSRLIPYLESGEGLRALPLDVEAEKLIRQYGIMTRKPLLVVANVAEDDLAHGAVGPGIRELQDYCDSRGWQLFVLSARVESEIAQLEPSDRGELLSAFHLDEPGLHRFVRSSYAALDLVTFFTVGEDEVRGWTVQRGSNAKRAAGVIHSDLERGFIRAEVIPWATLVECGSLAEAKRRGVLRIEGKDYLVQDGDVFHVRFSV